MKKKSAMILLLSFFLIIISSNVVSVSPPTDIFKWFSESQTWPPYPPGSSNDEFPRWYIGLIWLALGSVVFMTASKLFEKIHHKNAIIALAFAFSGIAVGGTGFVQGVASIIGFGVGGLTIIGVIAGVSLFLGLLGGSLKLAGKGVELGSQGTAAGYEAAREAKRDITGEKRDEQVEQRLLSGLEQLEQGGIKDINHIVSYVQEIMRVLSDANALKNKKLRQVLADRIHSVNSSVSALRLHTSSIQRVTRSMERVSLQEINLLKREMIAARNKARGAAHARTDAQINTYVNTVRSSVIADYRNETKMAIIELRLNTAGTEIMVELSNGVKSLNANDIPGARINFGKALSQAQIIGSELAELENIEKGIEARIQSETKGLSALEHLNRI